MIHNFLNFDNLIFLLEYQNIYLIANWGVIPFWLMLLFFPHHSVTNFFVQSIIIPIVLGSAYIFAAYNIFIDGNLLDSFELYKSLDGLYAMLSSEAFLLIFWLHFLTLSLFVGAWIARDSQKYFMPKFFIIVSLITTYFSGPVGLSIYWLIRIFYAKKINFND